MKESSLTKQQQKEKIRERYKGVDPNVLEVIPARKKPDFYDDVPRRVAVYVRVSTDNINQTFLTLSLGSVPAIANEGVDDCFTVDYLLDADNSNTYKLIVVSDLERHNSVITTVDLFEEVMLNELKNLP